MRKEKKQTVGDNSRLADYLIVAAAAGIAIGLSAWFIASGGLNEVSGMSFPQEEWILTIFRG